MSAGARVLRQDPVECLFQFVCSSNNHISRIHGMVERLCRAHGTPLPVVDQAAADSLPEVATRAVNSMISAGPSIRALTLSCHALPCTRMSSHMMSVMPSCSRSLRSWAALSHAPLQATVCHVATSQL